MIVFSSLLPGKQEALVPRSKSHAKQGTCGQHARCGRPLATVHFGAFAWVASASILAVCRCFKGTWDPAQQNASWHEDHETLVPLPHKAGESGCQSSIWGFRLGWLVFYNHTSRALMSSWPTINLIATGTFGHSGLMAPEPDDWMLAPSKHLAAHACRFPSKPLQVYTV